MTICINPKALQNWQRPTGEGEAKQRVVGLGRPPRVVTTVIRTCPLHKQGNVSVANSSDPVSQKPDSTIMNCTGPKALDGTNMSYATPSAFVHNSGHMTSTRSLASPPGRQSRAHTEDTNFYKPKPFKKDQTLQTLTGTPEET